MRLVIILFLLCLSGAGYATDYYVGGTGASDSNPGTSSQPFLTIQKAAGIAKSGDVVNIRAGTYRETIVPAQNGITFQSSEGAVISGLNAVTGAWTVHSGNIYKTTLNAGPMFTEYMTGFNFENLQSTNSQMLAQQIFKDGEMQMLAAYPKAASADQLLQRSVFRSRVNAPNFGPTAITDAGFAPFGNLTGGVVTVNGWFITATRTITGQNGNTINYGTTYDGDHVFSNFYRVTGKLGLLTQAGEWHYENNTLYYWQPGGGSPTGMEYKARNWGFDLRNKSAINIIGLHFMGCDPVMTTPASTNITIDNIRAKYTSHHLLETKGGMDGYNDSNVQTGTKLLGAGSVLKNSEFNYASGVTVWAGSNVTIQNNKFENGGYGGLYPGFIKLAYSGTTGTTNVKILYNTFSRSGRGAIELTANQSNASHSNLEIGYNDFTKFNMLCVDGGAVYAARKTILNNSRAHHNWFHNDGGFDEGGTGQQKGIQVNGVYFDQASGPITLDHNVHWNSVSGAGRTGAYSADFYTQTWWIEINVYANGTSKLYNNTFTTTTGGGQYSYVTYQNTNNDVQRNNIYRSGIVVNWGHPGDVANGLFSGVTPQFLGTGNSGLAYRLKTGSPAINAGMVINGITDGSVGTPDIGAYEFGGTDWVPGYQAVTVNPTPNTPPTVAITAPANNATVAAGTAINFTATASDANGSVTRVEWFDGTTKIGEDLTSPYSFTWNGATAGAHSVTARATDNQNAIATSAAISITVTGAANTAPTVSITSPANNATSPAGTAITINATAADANGTVAKVEFFDGAVKLGEDTSSPYSFAWTTPTAGAHTLTAKATDNQAGVTTSAAVTITITGAPGNTNPTVSISSPTNNATSAAGTAITITATAADANGTVAKVEFFDGAIKLGEDTSSPYSYAWASPAGGVHKLTAKATDNQAGATTSAAVTVTITTTTPGQNALPAVSITSPADNATFEAGQDITITADATDSDGSITLVEFYAGANKLGEDADAPYTFTWPSVDPGNHALTVLVTDNDGGAATSAPVDITVNTTPTTPPAVGEETDLYSGIPRFFSPNGDGSGDLWVWASNPKYANASVQVYNRASQLVYQSSAYNNAWDGRSDGQPLQDGDYYYVVRLADLTELRASVRIIR